VHALFGGVMDAMGEKLPQVAAHLDAARADILAFTASSKAIWRQIWSNNPKERLTGRSGAAPTSSGSSLPVMPSSVPAEQHDEWTEIRRYIGLTAITA